MQRTAPFVLFVWRSAFAQGLPPWVDARHLPIDEDVQSVVVTHRDEPLFMEPSSRANRRGAAAAGARLPLYGVAAGSGCPGDFLQVGSMSWVCGDAVRVSTEPPLAAEAQPPVAVNGLPVDYFFVGTDGAFGYADLSMVENTRPTAEFQPGFAVALTESASRGGPPFGLTTKGLWLPLENLRKVRSSSFHGYEVEDGKFDRGFVVTEGAPVYAEPMGKRLPSRRHRLEVVPVIEVREAKGKSFVKVGEAEWLDGGDVRLPAGSDVPAEAAPGERWLDVDRANQVLIAYEGTLPVYTTLVSTGVGHEGEDTQTPAGVYRIWVKLRMSDMTNLEDEDARRYYAIEEVPWVMFFHQGYGLHGAFWHESFGHVRSHGCVNLAPLDAERLFRFTSPRLPAGWTAVLPTEYEPGTVVRVR